MRRTLRLDGRVPVQSSDSATFKGGSREVNRAQVRQSLQGVLLFDFPYRYESWEPEFEEVGRIRARAIEELARGWKDDPDTQRWLKDRAAINDRTSARQAAVHEVARGWKNDPDTLKWLKDTAATNERPVLRQAAVHEVAHGWKDDLETLPWINQLAGAEDWVVRQAAIRELALVWRDNPATLTLLKKCGSGDAHPFVRQAAVQQVARGWKGDPGILSWLKEWREPVIESSSA